MQLLQHKTSFSTASNVHGLTSSHASRRRVKARDGDSDTYTGSFPWMNQHRAPYGHEECGRSAFQFRQGAVLNFVASMAGSRSCLPWANVHLAPAAQELSGRKGSQNWQN
jgi:hypothetical protein